MTRDEWMGLPLSVALGLLFDGSEGVRKIAIAAEAPRKPRSPKWDMRIYRKGGHNWASEMDIDGLKFWHGRATQSAESGSEWAEKDRKKAEKLQYWITWREWEPTARWHGTRDEHEVTAKPPSSRPDLYSKLPLDDERDAIESEGDAL